MNYSEDPYKDLAKEAIQALEDTIKSKDECIAKLETIVALLKQELNKFGYNL